MKRLLTFIAIAAGLAGTTAAAELLPLEMGNYWTYREDRTGETFTVRVGQPIWMRSGKLYHRLVGYAGDWVFARVDETGNLVTLNEETGAERLLTGFAEGDGRWWHAPGRECLQEGQTQEKRTTYDGPGGRWRGVVEVKYQSSACADAGVISEQFAGNIGMLRRVVTTIAGPRTFDLVYARIGTQIIETGDRGRFSATVDHLTGQKLLRVTLRVDIGITPSIRLGFPSAQEFDVALRDATGKVIWQWSDGKFFAQAAREKSIGNVWTETVAIPRPAGDLDGYTIEGWLTTAPGEPKFAATAPIPPPHIGLAYASIE
jgi:hypothetical protein